MRQPSLIWKNIYIFFQQKIFIPTDDEVPVEEARLKLTHMHIYSPGLPGPKQTLIS